MKVIDIFKVFGTTTYNTIDSALKIFCGPQAPVPNNSL